MKSLKLKKGRFPTVYGCSMIVVLLAFSTHIVKAQIPGDSVISEDVKAAFQGVVDKWKGNEKLEIAYYGAFEPELKGKVKLIDGVVLEYYTGDFYPELKGKLKSIGGYTIKYYTDNFYPEINGKIKSIGNTEITYYTGSFYPEIQGKVKTIGNVSISYYTGSFYPEIQGKVKFISGNIDNNLAFLLVNVIGL